MRIAQIAPLFESVPPSLYGGSERVVSWLTEELVRLGHEVTLFASGDSRTSARLVPACEKALWRDSACRETLPHHISMLELVFRELPHFDVLHFHCDYVHFPLVRRYGCSSISTLHGSIHLHDLRSLLEEYRDVPLVSISHNQRQLMPHANWVGNVHHGLPLELHRFRHGSGGYLAFLGRVSPEKGLERAIEIARRTGHKLKVAAKIYEEDRPYYEHTIEPLLCCSSHFVEFLGEIGGADKDELLGDAKALLFPVEWSEPFGLVMIEALATGTPVIAWRRGSVPEVVQHGVTGFVVSNTDEGAEAVAQLNHLDRNVCRQDFEARFTSERMAKDYLRLYEDAIATRSASNLPMLGVRG
jgi:glycosyltransferase involved in cell wall biosynthesis